MFYEPKKGIPFEIDPFKSLVFPRPIGWISSISKNGVSNIAPYSYFNSVADDPPQIIHVRKGEMVFTPPMVDHGMKFPVDTVFLTLSRNPRDQESYEADVVRVEFVATEGLTTWTPGDDDT